MTIIPYLDGSKFDRETKHIIGVAFEMTCAALRLTDRDDLLVAMVAKRIIELAREGERNPELLCERALNDLRGGVWRILFCHAKVARALPPDVIQSPATMKTGLCQTVCLIRPFRSDQSTRSFKLKRNFG
jgi:hypothetical protein